MGVEVRASFENQFSVCHVDPGSKRDKQQQVSSPTEPPHQPRLLCLDTEPPIVHTGFEFTLWLILIVCICL